MDNDIKDWIARIKNGSEEELKLLYSLYRDEFVLWSIKIFKLRAEEAADVFQEAVISFYWNVKNEAMTSLTSTAKTYLFAVGKNIALKKIRKNGRMIVDNEVMELNAQVVHEVEIECNERQQLLVKLLEDIGDPCRSIITMFYFDRFTADSIATRLGYKNEHVVKSQKLRCLKKLRTQFKNLSIFEEDI